MEVSIIIINYKSCALVMDCISSIVAATAAGSYEIIVVDNDSQDGAKEKILTQWPDVRWIEMGYNAGFARANNAGMRIAKGNYMLILNSDTIIQDKAIDKTIALLHAYPGAVGAGVQLLNTDGSTQISGAHFKRGGLNTLLPLPYLGRMVRWLGYRLNTKIPSVQQVQQDVEVDWIVGAYIMVQKNVLDKAGLFDEDFFMYAEEIEWCARLRKYGKLVLFAEPKVIHIGGGTSSDYYNTDESENGKNLWNIKGRQVMISNMLRIRKQFGVFWFCVISGAYFAELPFFAVCLLADKILNGKKALFRWHNVSGYTGNIWVLLQYWPKLLINKKYFYKVA
ncbi:MAG TPA: glycosyltransferase family 2 protein [Ferruginibacter sp.]|nr:glycosyltransferase family 2 protein [Ferruginibacter sp.]HMP21720.1 glycosyltransferase family 2 protein [Ferruginibacter sp.]